MSKKLTIAAVEQAAKNTGISDEARAKLVEILADMTAEEEGEEKAPPVKKQWCFVLADPTGRFTAEFFEASGIGALTGWVVQIPEDASPHTAPARLRDCAHHFNSTKRGRMCPVQTLGEAVENVTAKITKQYGVWIKTKTPIFAIPAANELPDTPSVLGDDRGSPRIDNMSVTITSGQSRTVIDATGIHSTKTTEEKQ